MSNCKSIIDAFFYRENEGSRVEDFYEKIKDPKLKIVKTVIPSYDISTYITKCLEYYDGMTEFIDDLDDRNINDENNFNNKILSYIEKDKVFMTNLLYEVKKSYNDINILDWQSNFNILISLKDNISRFIRFSKKDLSELCSRGTKYDNICILYKKSTLVFILNALLMIFESYRELVRVLYEKETIRNVNNTLDDNRFVVL